MRGALYLAALSALLLLAAAASPEELAEWQRQTDEIAAQKLAVDALREASRQLLAARNETANGTLAPGPRRLGVCITGQMARLELDAKIAHLLVPNAADFTIDVVLALAPMSSGSTYSFGAHDAGGHMAWTPELIRSTILERTRLGNGTVVVDDAPQLASPKLQYAYAHSMYGASFGGDGWRRNHVRMWRSYWQCYQHFAQLELANGGEPYAALVKVRDDGVPLVDVRVAELEARWAGRVLLPTCRPEGGFNDRWAIMDAQHGYAYLGAQLVDYYLAFEQLWAASWRAAADPRRTPGNPEIHLKGALLLHGAPAVLASPDEVPILQARSAPAENGARVCFNPVWQDQGKALECAPADSRLRGLMYCSRCSDGAAGHSEGCARMCECARARDEGSARCAGRLTEAGGGCWDQAVLRHTPIENAGCELCVRHRCSLWHQQGTCAAHWDFTDPQGSERLECECACCRQACGHERSCFVGAFAKRAGRLAEDAPAAALPSSPRPLAAPGRIAAARGASAAGALAAMAALAALRRQRRRGEEALRLAAQPPTA